MTMRLRFMSVVTTAVLLLELSTIPRLSSATSLGGGSAPEDPPGAKPTDENMTKRRTLKKYAVGCQVKPVKEANCDKLRKDVVEILKEDLYTLGSSANRTYIPGIVKVFKSNVPELRIAVADAIGMIGPEDSDADILAPLTNDPVPDVRHAVSQMISRAKGAALTLLKERTIVLRTGRTPETPVDAGKYSMPVAPDSAYRFDSSDASMGRISYVTKNMNEVTAFYKGKAKKGPFPLAEFKEKYRYQLQDEDEVARLKQQAEVKQLENIKPPDPTNVPAFTEYMQKIASAGAKQGIAMYLDAYQPNLFGSPTVYVLEERQIGQRSYPTRYVVLYQEQALRKPGYRLAWMTVPDDALKAAQVASLKEQREEEAEQATMRKEEEAAKKRDAELEGLTKKKDATEKKQFKKGQEDLEKALGF